MSTEMKFLLTVIGIVWGTISLISFLVYQHKMLDAITERSQCIKHEDEQPI